MAGPIQDDVPIIGEPTNPGAAYLEYYARKDPEGLKKLRQVVRKHLLAADWPPETITEYQVDAFIASRLPETVESMIKKAVDAQLA